jgi:hypothetical protein
LVGLAGDVGVAEALEEMVDGAGAVHAAAFGVVGVGEVGEVEAGEGEGGGEAGLDEWGERGGTAVRSVGWRVVPAAGGGEDFWGVSWALRVQAGERRATNARLQRRRR